MKRRLGLALSVAVITAPTGAWSLDLPVSYRVDAKLLKAAPAGTLLTFDLHADPTCSSLTFTDTVDIADVGVLIDRLKAFKVKGATKPVKAALLNTTLAGVSATEGLHLEVTGTGVSPVGSSCQAQPSGIEGPQGAIGAPGPQGNPGPAGDSHWQLNGSTTYYNDGNVGIGTSTPFRKLQVAVTGTEEGFRIRDDVAGVHFGVTRNLIQQRGSNMFLHAQEGDIELQTTSPATTRLVIRNATGNVGIGTVLPADKLHVSGGNIRVSSGSFIDDGTTLDVPDYVFEGGYPLMPLGDLRAYIARTNHLPNVPSSAEIKMDGLNLSHFQMKLLEKIEELTLYTLAQQHQLETQQARIDTLAAQR